MARHSQLFAAAFAVSGWTSAVVPLSSLCMAMVFAGCVTPAREMTVMSFNVRHCVGSDMKLDVPRVAAATLAMPVLTIFAELAGLVGGAIVLQLMRVPAVVYWSHVADTTSIFIILLGLGKSALFGLLVGLIGCSAGMRTRNTADGVGVAATAAVVGGIVAIAVTDGLIAVVCYILGV